MAHLQLVLTLPACYPQDLPAAQVLQVLRAGDDADMGSVSDGE